MAQVPWQLWSALAARVDLFASKVDLVELYRGYSWERDTYTAGFPDILRLEMQLGSRGRKDGITLEDIRDVAKWGHLRNQARIEGPAFPLRRSDLYDSQGKPKAATESLVLEPLHALGRTTQGLGPTYLSKVLRFALPEHYGAIDSRCVRVFGKGDPRAQQHDWLTLKASNYGSGWAILETQRAWPDDYALWVTILRHVASQMPVPCPHPRAFIKARLRQLGQWTCADVEMALFTYASRSL